MGRYSVSRVNTYLENPFKHWCKYIAKYKPKYDNEKNKYMDRGTVFHKAMELFSESKGNISKLEVAQKIKQGIVKSWELAFKETNRPLAKARTI